jgi:hypothetical protein
MGQLALGLRSLVVKTAIFVVMAALLAWALGGTLWPREETVELPGVSCGDKLYNWQLAVGGGEEPPIRWHLFVRRGEESPVVYRQFFWTDVSRILVIADSLYFGGQTGSGPTASWKLYQVIGDDEPNRWAMPDRLAVEQQLDRIERGLAVQDAQEILAHREQSAQTPPIQ